LISKVYFPRLVMPAAGVLAGLLDFAIAFVLLLAMMLYYRIRPGLEVLAVPLFVLLAVVTALGVGIWLAALNVKYRDINHAIPFLIQTWLFVTPVAYSSDLIPARYRPLYELNPMVGVIEGFRWALLGTDVVPIGSAVLSAGVALAVLVAGLFFFRYVERGFADVV
jgi:lipopolysaccharide transport system permease protein